MNKVTIQDIADAASVSKATVSRVLNGTAAVTADKKQAVLDATSRLNFQPNVVARSLSRGRSMTIGVLTQIIGSPVYDTIVQGVIAGLHDTGYSPIFVDGRWQHSREVEAIRALLLQRVDGLVLIGGGVGAEELTQLCGDVPTVIVARQLSHHHCVFMDNVDGGYQATRHLIDQGHKRIAIVKGLAHHADAIDRLTGYRKAMQESNLSIHEELILDGDFSAESGRRSVEQLLTRGVCFTAIVAANDLTAFGARLALHRSGISVPDEVSIVGYDDQMESAYMTPPLTTVHQPALEMGQVAARGVLSLIDGDEFGQTSICGDLIVRESVSPIR